MTCVCDHDLEDHEMIQVTDGSGYDRFRKCAVEGCPCCAEELRELVDLRGEWVRR